MVYLDKEKVIKLDFPDAELLQTIKTFELATRVDKIIDISQAVHPAMFTPSRP